MAHTHRNLFPAYYLKEKIEYYEENKAPRYANRGFLQFPLSPANVSIVPIRSEDGCGRIYPPIKIKTNSLQPLLP